MTPESRVARAFRNEVKKLGGWCAKISGEGMRGIPDYVVIFDGFVSFVELKADKGALTELQKTMHKQLRVHGASVFVAYGGDHAKTVARTLAGAKGLQRMFEAQE